LTFILILAVAVIGCKSEREKQIEKINKESIEILSEVTSKLIVANVITQAQADTIIQTYTKIASDSAELGYQYAIIVKDFANSPESYQQTNNQSNSTDTTTYFDLKIVKKWNDYGYAHLSIELTNRFDKHIDNFWIEAELRDKNGNYLAGKQSIHYNNVRPGKKMVEEESWENTNVNEVGSVLLTPYRLEIEGQVYNFETRYVKILDNKYGIKVTF